MKKLFFAVLTTGVVFAAASCSNKSGLVSKGSASKVDTLSYYLGLNIGRGVAGEMKEDIPFNIKLVEKGLNEGMLEKSSQSQEDAVDILRDFFSNKLQERRAAAELLAEADSLAADQPLKFDAFESDDECDEVSYAFGNDIGSNLRASKIPIQTVWIVKGFDEGYNELSDIEDEDIQNFLQNYFMVVAPQKALERSNEWLKKMERKSGVKKTDSGLLYKIVKQGDMSRSASNDRDEVEVNYEGKTQDGHVFDSSYERGEPVSFALNRVIRGWTEGMKLVGPGGEIILYIPAELAYGPRGAGRDIGPNEALEFKVELLDVRPYEVPEPVEAEPAAEE